MFKELSGKSGKYSNYCKNMRRTTCNKRRKSSRTDIKSFLWLLITLFLPFFRKTNHRKTTVQNKISYNSKTLTGFCGVK